MPWCLRQGRAWEDVWRAELLSRVAAENTPRTVLEQLLDHVISEDVDHQLGRAWEDLDENGLLLTVARGFEPLLNVPRSMLVLAKRIAPSGTAPTDRSIPSESNTTKPSNIAL